MNADFPSHVTSLVLASMTDQDKAKFLSETIRGPGVVCVNWPMTIDDLTATALGHASRILWRTKKLPEHPASRIIADCIRATMNELLTHQERSQALVHDLALTWFMLKNAATQTALETVTPGSSLPSVAEDLVFQDSI